MSLFKREVEKIYCKRMDTPRAKIPSDRMCDDKASFSEGMAKKKAKHWGQRAYECPVCFKWHLTKKDRR